MEKNLEELLSDKLRERGLRLALAESCTGGLVGHRLTNIAGSSTYYMGSVTAYAYEAKVRLLNVRWETLEDHGAVSAEAVKEMARGVRHALAADLGISISGIAGPSGGTQDKPVGTVWIGLSAPDGDWSRLHHFDGDRIEVKQQAADAALQFGLDYLGDTFAEPIEVKAITTPKGKIMPQSFSANGTDYSIESTGRRWDDERGLHILVMTRPEETVFELLYKQDSDSWYLARRLNHADFA